MRKAFLVIAIFALGASIAVAQPDRMAVRKTEAAAPCTAGTMTSLFFLKIPEIRGDSRDRCHENEIEVLSFRNAGNAISVTKRIDISSPQLLLAALERRSFHEATLTVLETGVQTRMITYVMKGAMINSLDQTAASGNNETLEFRFNSLMTKMQDTTATGQAATAAPVPVSFAIAQTQSPVSLFTSGVSASQLREIVVIKPIDASSLKLGQARQTGEHIAEITITLRPASDSLTYKLSDVLVVSDVQQGSGSGQSETVHLKPSRITLEYNSSSRPGTSVKTGWDIKQNKKM